MASTRHPCSALTKANWAAVILSRDELRPPLVGSDRAVGEHKGALFALQNLRLDASKQEFGGILGIGNLAQRVQKVPRDFKRVFDEGW